MPGGAAASAFREANFSLYSQSFTLIFIFIFVNNNVSFASWLLSLRERSSPVWLWVLRKSILLISSQHVPLIRYVKLRVVHASGMSGTFSPPPWVSDPDTHRGTCVTHVPWCMPESLTSGFLWSRWRGKCSRHFRRMRNPQFYISGKRPIAIDQVHWTDVVIKDEAVQLMSVKPRLL